MRNQQRFEGSSLEAVLELAQDALDEDAVIVAANRLRSGGIAGFFAKERFEIIVEASPTVTEPVFHHDTPSMSLLDLADRVSDQEQSSCNNQRPPQPSTFAAMLSKFSEEDRLDLVSLDQSETVTDRGVNGHRSALGYYDPVSSVPTPAAASEESVNLRTMKVLSELGLPQAMVSATCQSCRGADPHQLSASLLRSMQKLPQPPCLPRFEGAIIAVVGDLHDARELARLVAIELRLDPEHVLLASSSYKGRDIASSLRISDTGRARELSTRWRHLSQTRVVAVASSSRPDETLWAAHLIGALQPTAVWAIANANQKNEDVVAWSDRLGGIDALALTHLDETVSPAALLHTGIPIVRLDGRIATPALWTALLTERLAA